MSMTIAFDTLDYARKLENAGVPRPQAEQRSILLAEVLGKALASPSYLAAPDRSLNSNIDKLGLKLSGEINHVKWILGTMMAINIAVALKLFLT